MRPAGDRQVSRRGFTLVELMVVLVLIAMMTALIIPEMRGTYEDALLRSTARKLIAVFGAASSRAVSINEPHRVRLDGRRGRYFIESRSRDAAGEGSRFAPVRNVPGSEGRLDERISVSVRRDVGEEPAGEPDAEGSAAPGLSSNRLSGGGDKDGAEVITFYGDGRADGCELVLTDRAGMRLVLRINPTTGRVRIAEPEHDGL